MDDLIEALQILRKYDNPTYPTHCEHDALRVYINPEDVSDKDKEKLDEMGFIVDEEFECFLSYRYGSC